jgi:hypothetical protein
MNSFRKILNPRNSGVLILALALIAGSVQAQRTQTAQSGGIPGYTTCGAPDAA